MITDERGNVLFTDAEIACKCCGRADLADGFADRLRALRVAYGKPIIPNCLARCRNHNQAVGGHPNSLHLLDGGRLRGAAAIDVQCPPGTERAELVTLALNAGWSVGTYKTFIHLDRRDLAGLPQAMFMGGY